MYMCVNVCICASTICMYIFSLNMCDIAKMLYLTFTFELSIMFYVQKSTTDMTVIRLPKHLSARDLCSQYNFIIIAHTSTCVQDVSSH